MTHNFSDFYISSPEPKSQVSFSDQNLSVVRGRCHPCWRRCCCCRKLFTFSSFSPTTGSISTKLGTKHPWVKGIHVCSNEEPRAFLKGDNYEIAKKTLTISKNLLLKNHWTNLNQTWHKVSLCEEDSSLFKWRAQPFSKGKQWRNSWITLTKFFYLRTTWPI